MSDEDIELIRQLFTRWEQGDFTTPEFFDPDVEVTRVGGDAVATSGTWRGINDMSKALVEWLHAWENLRAEPKHYIDRGDRVLVIARQTGRGRRSGLGLDHAVGLLFTIRDGKIARLEQYWETTDALRAAGLEDT